VPEVGRQRKNQPWKGNVWCCGIDIPFSEYKIGKRKKVLFLYGVPSEVKGQLQTERYLLSAIKSYEVVFQRYNFLHLTGVRVNFSGVGFAIHF